VICSEELKPTFRVKPSFSGLATNRQHGFLSIKAFFARKRSRTKRVAETVGWRPRPPSSCVGCPEYSRSHMYVLQLVEIARRRETCVFVPVVRGSLRLRSTYSRQDLPWAAPPPPIRMLGWSLGQPSSSHSKEKEWQDENFSGPTCSSRKGRNLTHSTGRQEDEAGSRVAVGRAGFGFDIGTSGTA
jgi:hypothetical protein